MLFRDPHQPDPAAQASSARTLLAEPASAQPDALLYGWRPRWAGLVLKARPWLIALGVLYHLVCFNGQWRVGNDSAVYRAVGHSLATGGGYAVLGQPHDHVYPGLPVLLGLLERLFGDAAWPGVVVMLAATALTLWVVYLLVRRVLPDWAATLVTAGVAFNWRFAQQGHELMTDLPFLLGIVMALLGADLARSRAKLWQGIALATLGTVLAATMRPTFWVLVVAAAALAGWTLVQHLRPRAGTGRRRLWAVVAVNVAVIAGALLFVVFDPRVAGDGSGRPANGQGRYERELFGRVHDWITGRANPVELAQGVWTIINEDLPRLFFGERVVVLNVIFTLALLGGVGLVALRRDDLSKRRPLWGLMIVVLAGTCLVLSSEPRYWMMVLPILWVGWVLGLAQGAADWFKTDVGRGRWVAAGLSVVFLGNAVHLVKFAIEQRSTPFLRHYKQGELAPIHEFAMTLREQVPEGDVIVGPHSAILSYWSQRRVLGERELEFGTRDEVGERLEALRDCGAEWMLFPHGPYRDKDYKLGRLIRDGYVWPTNETDDEAISLDLIDGEGELRYWWVAPFEIDERELKAAGEEQASEGS